mmetsp:Transcript_19775/g.68618  ORF Transcript_19775/g.68618 Transcript_19775/m.68618 type:complete len:255 (+) Transcript_19775:580-1344(+)
MCPPRARCSSSSVSLSLTRSRNVCTMAGAQPAQTKWPFGQVMPRPLEGLMLSKHNSQVCIASRSSTVCGGASCNEADSARPSSMSAASRVATPTTITGTCGRGLLLHWGLVGGTSCNERDNAMARSTSSCSLETHRNAMASSVSSCSLSHGAADRWPCASREEWLMSMTHSAPGGLGHCWLQAQGAPRPRQWSQCCETELKYLCPVFPVCCHDAALSSQVSPHVMHVIGRRSDGSHEAKAMSAARLIWSMLRAC